MRHPYAPIRFIRIAIFGLALLCPNTSYAQDYTTDLVGHWKLDETSGTTATDSSGNGYNGAMVNGLNGAIDTRTGILGTALYFSGSSDQRITIPHTSDLNAPSGYGTWSFWFKTDGSWSTGVGGDAVFMAKHTNNCANTGASVTLTNTTGLLRVKTSDNNCLPGNDCGISFTDLNLLNNNWHHIAFTFGKLSTDVRRLYIDGNQVGTCTSASNWDFTSSFDLFIGDSQESGSEEFKGTLDDVRVYDRALSAADIDALYDYSRGITCLNPSGVTGEMLFNNDARALQYCNASSWIGIGPANSLENGLVGHWKLDETSGTTAADETGSYNGTMTGALTAAAATTSGVIGTSIHFDGSGDYINASAIPEMQGATTLTLSGWLKRNTLGDYVHFGSDNGIAGGTSIGYSGGTLYFATAIGSWAYGSYSLNDTQWHHVTMVYNGSGAANSDKIKGYIDGVEVALSYTGTIPAATYNNASNIMRIGRFSGYRSDGDIDDVRVYDRALSASEITQLYNKAPTCVATTTNLVGHWKMDETSGTVATDSSPSGNDGTMTTMNGASDSVTGQIGSALSFTSSSRITAGAAATNIDDIFNGGGTISYWLYPTSWGTFGRAMDKSDAGGYPPNSGWHQQGTGTRPIFSQAFSGGTGQWELASGSTPLNTWSHLSITYDSSDANNDPTFYINGAPVALFTDSNATGTAISDAANPITFGSPQGGGNNYTGYIDDVHMYNRALSETEVSALYGATGGMCSVSTCAAPSGTTGEIVFNTDYDVMQYCNGSNWIAMGPPGDGGAGCTNPTGLAAELHYNTDLNVVQYCEGDEWIAVIGTNNASIPTAGLVGHWALDETSGSSIADSSGNGNTGIWSDGSGNDVAEETIAGQVGTAITFDGNNDLVSSGSAAILDNMTTMTTCAWVYPTSTDTWDGIVNKSNGVNNGWQLYLQSPSGIGFYTNEREIAEKDNVTTLNTWQHVCATWDGTDGTSGIKLYFNGLEQTPDNASTYAAGTSDDSTLDLEIGRIGDAGSFFNGAIDDVLLYNRSLSSSEILSIYNATK